MKIRLEQLAAHLKKPLSPIYVVSGDEPLQVGETCDSIRACAKEQGYSEREVMHVERGFDWARLASAANTLSLFASQRLIELRMPSTKPGDAGGKALRTYAEQLPADTILLIVTGKLDAQQQRSKWFKTLEGVGVVIQVWPIDIGRLPQWLGQRMQQRGLQPDAAVLSMLADRVEGNLLAADQELEKLLLLYGEGPLSIEQATAAVSDSARYDVFTLVDATLEGDAARATHILNGLRAEGVEPVLVLWALAREIRAMAGMAREVQAGLGLEQVMGQYRVWDKRKPPVRAGLQRHPLRAWHGLLWQAGEIDRCIKGMATGRPWDELLQLVVRMAGTPLFRRIPQAAQAARA